MVYSTVHALSKHLMRNIYTRIYSCIYEPAASGNIHHQLSEQEWDLSDSDYVMIGGAS